LTSKIGSPLRTAAVLCASQLVSYTLLTVNFRAIASGQIAVALMTDAANATIVYFVIKRIAQEPASVVPWLGYLLGSLLGTAAGMLIS